MDIIAACWGCSLKWLGMFSTYGCNIIPMAMQAAGLLGLIQSSCSIAMNVLHCTFFGGIAMEDIVMPAFNKMGDLFGGDK